MATSCQMIRKKILYCGNSWTKCLTNLARSYSRKRDEGYKEEKATRDKMEELLNELYNQPVINTEQEYYRKRADPNWEGHSKSAFESRFYSKKHGISDEVKSWLYWDININDDLYLRNLMKLKEFGQLKKDQIYRTERTEAVGVDLGAAHFIVARGGAVKFNSRETWYAKNAKGEYSLPRVYVEDLFVEGIDASNMKLTHVALDTLGCLGQLRFLRLHNCEHIDDWCLARLQRLSNCLEFLDLSNCPVTDQGLLVLHRLHNLKCLKVSKLDRVKHLGLITLLLEEKIPGLAVIGVTEDEMKPPTWSHRGERRLVRAYLGLMDGEDVEEQSEFTPIDNIRNTDLKRFARPVDS